MNRAKLIFNTRVLHHALGICDDVQIIGFCINEDQLYVFLEAAWFNDNGDDHVPRVSLDYVRS